MAKLVGMFVLGSDVKSRDVGDDTAHSFSAAYICGRKKKGEKYAPSQWVDVTAWNKQGEIIGQYVSKGSQIYLELGDVVVHTYEKDGETKATLRGRVDGFEFVRGERKDEGEPAKPAPKNSAQSDGFDDDIPFAPIARGIAGHCYWG